MLEPLQLSLVLLLAAAVVLYAGTRLLWSSIASTGLWRGVIISSPLIALAVVQSAWSPPSAIALLVSAGVLSLTLGLGISTIDLPPGDSGASPLLRCVLPLTATVCLAGFHGELSWLIAIAIAVVGGLTLWTADGERRVLRVDASPLAAMPATVLLIAGLCLLAAATWMFRRASGSAAPTPVVVLLTAPAVLLALLGLLSAEGRQHHAETPQETAVGLAIGCLGIGLPAAILCGTFLPAVVAASRVVMFSTNRPRLSDVHAAFATARAPVVMPLSTWRVDAVLLVVVAILLLPIGASRFRLGRVEGAALILLYLAYAAVATRTGALTG